MRARIWLVLIVALAAGSGPAMARDANVYYHHQNDPVSATAPLGFSLHCLMQKQDCQPGGSSIVLKTSELMQQLKMVNRSVNASIIPTAGLEDAVWQVDPKRGNCHDYALTKRQHLIALGISPSALRVAYVKTRSGEGHAVLIVVTDKGELVLDNLTGRIVPKSQANLRFISISTVDPMQWILL